MPGREAAAGLPYTRRPDLYDRRTPEELLPGEFDFYRSLAADPILELGCGTGRVSLPLARAGFEVTGIEISRAMLDHARRKLEGEPPEVRARVALVQGDMASCRLRRRFRLVILPDSPFLHLASPALQRECLRRIAEHLAPGGAVAGHFARPRASFAKPTPLERLDAVQRLPDGMALHTIWTTRVDEHEQAESQLRCARTFAADGRLMEGLVDRVDLTYLHAREWRMLLELEGFRLERLDGDFVGTAPAAGTEWVWVARR